MENLKLTKAMLDSVSHEDVIKFQLTKGLKSIGTKAGKGHYLDRAIAIAEAFSGPVGRYLPILTAFREYMDSYGKPQAIDSLLYDFSCAFLSCVEEAGLTSKDIEVVAWGLDFQALKDYGYLEARNNPSPIFRGDQMKTTKPKLLMSAPNLPMFLEGLNKFWCNPYSIQLHENGVIVVNGKVMDRSRYVYKGGRFRLEMTNY